MKRIFAFLLTLSMLITVLSAMPLCVSAQDAESADSQAVPKSVLDEVTTGEKIGEVSGYEAYADYCVVRDFDGLRAMSAGGNYILANDITYTAELTDCIVSAFSSDFVLEGNGYDLSFSKLSFGDGDATADYKGLFSAKCSYDLTIRHLTVNVEKCTVGKRSSVIYAATNNKTTTVKTEYVTVNADSAAMEGESAGVFLGYLQANDTASFKGCTVSGALTYGNKTVQGAAFIALNNGTATFEDCVVNASLRTAHERKAGFIGQVDGTKKVSFVNCSVTGDIIAYDGEIDGAKLVSLGGFIGSVTKAANITFTDCTASAEVSGSDNIGGFIGYVNDAATVNFKKVSNGCNFDGKVISENNAGAFVGYGTSANIAAISVTDGENNGSVVCLKPTVVTGENTESFEMYVSKIGTPEFYYQTTEETDGKLDVRTLIAVKADKLPEIEKLNLTLTFGLSAGGNKILELDETSTVCYTSVNADGFAVTAPEGYVIFAVTVKNVVVSEWNESLSLSMSAEDGNGALMEEYNYSK